MLQCEPQTINVLKDLLARYGLTLATVDEGAPIPGSYWSEPEAGLVGTTIHVRADTPVHSALHETSHVVCMDPVRRTQLHTDAGGEFSEEDAVCYLQIVLATQLGIAKEQLCADMDSWGYTFRLGSAQAWFERDAEDARAWLQQHDLLDGAGAPVYRLRGA